MASSYTERERGGGPRETSTVVEALVLREKFTDGEREALIADGALIYTPTGGTLLTQRNLRTEKGKPSFEHITVFAGSALDIPSRNIEIAIYPAPDKAFVPGSFGKDLSQQEELVATDAADLRKRLGQKGLGQMIPDEASTVTDIIFQHEEATGEWLLGPKHEAAQKLDWVFVRTKNPEDLGYFLSIALGHPSSGLIVMEEHRDDSDPDLGVLRMVVPIETK